jgi:hypothetical protein
MRDKSLDIFLAVLFGVGGITILIITWAQPMPLTDRILATFVALTGLGWVLTRAMFLKPIPAEKTIERVDSRDTAKESVFVRGER